MFITFRTSILAHRRELGKTIAYLILLATITVGCARETTEEIEVTLPEQAKGVETFSDFVNLFPPATFPFELASEVETFNETSYPQLPDSVVDQFMQFEPWSWRDQDTVPFYAISAIENTDSTHLLLYMTVDSLPNWNLKNITIVNVTNEGDLLGRFVLGQQASAADYHSLGPVAILQTGGMNSANDGYLIRTTNTKRFGERVEKYTFNIDQDGQIDSEFVIKEE